MKQIEQVEKVEELEEIEEVNTNSVVSKFTSRLFVLANT